MRMSYFLTSTRLLPFVVEKEKKNKRMMIGNMLKCYRFCFVLQILETETENPWPYDR